MEGEGSFFRVKARPHQLRFGMQMKDEDVMRRFADLFGVPLYGPTSKGMWHVQLARHERVQHIVATVWPWLGSRRKAQITGGTV